MNRTDQIANDLWDRFAPDADPAALLKLDVHTIECQVCELRDAACLRGEHDRWGSDLMIARLLQHHAEQMLAAQ